MYCKKNYHSFLSLASEQGHQLVYFKDKTFANFSLKEKNVIYVVIIKIYFSLIIYFWRLSGDLKISFKLYKMISKRYNFYFNKDRK